MNTSGEAADQVMRMMLNGAEVLVKLSGSGAKNAAVLLYSIAREQKKTKGAARLESMLRSGKPLKVYTFRDSDLPKFKEVAKQYGILIADFEKADGGAKKGGFRLEYLNGYVPPVPGKKRLKWWVWLLIALFVIGTLQVFYDAITKPTIPPTIRPSTRYSISHNIITYVLS